MATVRSAGDILDVEFLAMRAKLLELASSLDRIERGDGSIADDARWQQILRGIETLGDGSAPQRAEQLQLLFSLPYQPQWRTHMGLKRSSTQD